MVARSLTMQVPVPGKLICAFVFAYAKCNNIHDQKHAHAIYRDFFKKQKLTILLEKIGFFCFIFAQNIHCRYTQKLPSTHNVCFGPKIRKLGIPLQIPFFFFINVGFKDVRCQHLTFRNFRFLFC